MAFAYQHVGKDELRIVPANAGTGPWIQSAYQGMRTHQFGFRALLLTQDGREVPPQQQGGMPFEQPDGKVPLRRAGRQRAELQAQTIDQIDGADARRLQGSNMIPGRVELVA